MLRRKDTDIDPLTLFRNELIAARRAAAAAHNLAATIEAQAKLELVDRAMADEEKAAH